MADQLLSPNVKVTVIIPPELADGALTAAFALGLLCGVLACVAVAVLPARWGRDR